MTKAEEKEYKDMSDVEKGYYKEIRFHKLCKLIEISN